MNRSVRPLRYASFLFALSLPLTGLQAQPPSDAVIEMTRIDNGGQRINLDGRLDENLWQDLPVIDDMRVIDPDTLEEAPLSTETRLFYDEEGIYVAAMNHQDPETLVARLSPRDTRVDRDAFLIALDASGEGLYGYQMRVNLGATLSDGTIQPEKQINRDWDGAWEAETQELDNGWSAEIFIPWSMMALPQAGDTRRIGIYLQRQVSHMNENWSWPALPDTNPEYLSAFQPFELRGINPSTQVTFYPYGSTTYDNIDSESEYRAGADIYWRPNANTQLSATILPDFGTVESDDVVVNLGAFETFFSEKRTFFLEGQEVFNATPRASGGGGPFGPTTMLNTRRIGQSASFDVPDDVSVDLVEANQPTELHGAVKATGQNGNWRYGTLLASEDDTQITGRREDDGTPVPITAEGGDFAVGRLLYEDTAGGGRRGLGWMGTRLSQPGNDAMVNGIDFHYFSADTRWVLDGQFLQSDVDDVTGRGVFADLEYRPRQGVQHSFTGTLLDDKLDINDVGFVQRNDHHQLDYRFSVTESGLDNFRTRRRSLNLINQWNSDGYPVRLGVFVGQGVTFHNLQQLDLQMRYFPPRTDDRLSRGNGTYKIPERWTYNVNWNSDRSRPLSFSAGINSSDEDLGPENRSYDLGIQWRPNDRITVDFETTYRDREAWLIHQGGDRMATFEAVGWFPELDLGYFIGPHQQFRMSLQWTGISATESRHYRVDQTDVAPLIPTEKPGNEPLDFNVSRLSFQARYRWEIAPLSDLFVVYTRGSDLDPDVQGDFSTLLQDSWTERIVDRLVVKLRYRLGS